MNKTEIHAKWRVLPVHLVAKLFGVLVKVEGMPFGSARIYRASPQVSAKNGCGGSPAPTDDPLSKSILEDEMKRRGVLADNTLDAKKFSEAERSDDAAKETLATFDALATIVTAAAEKRFAADPFAPTFELFAGEDAVTVKLYPRPGSVQYIVNVTGPRSSAVRMEGALPSPILVSQVVESPL